MKKLLPKIILAAAILLMLLSAVVGMGLLKDATPYGLGLRTDSSQYINGARNLLAGEGYTRTSGGGELKPITHFPPMFSSLIAAVSLSGLEAMRSARLLVILLFGGAILLFGFLLLRLTRSAFIAVVGAFLFATSAVFIEVYAWVMSEPLYLFLWLAVFLLVNFFWQYRRNWLLVLAGIACGAAYLTRYIGLTLFFSILVMLFLVESGWKAKIRAVLYLTAPFLVFLFAWSIRNIILIGTPTNRQLAYHPVPYAKIAEGINNFWNWLLPEAWNAFYQNTQIVFTIVFYLVLAAGLAVVVYQLIRLLPVTRKPAEKFSPTSLTVLALALSALVYLAMTLTSISFYDAATALEHRILTPVYVPVLVLILYGLAWLYHRPGILFKLVTIAGLLVVSWVSYTGGRIQSSLLARDGLGYANTTLRGSKVIEVIKALPPDMIIYTNKPQLVYLVADRVAYMTPVYFDSIAFEYRPNFERDLQTMRDQIRDGRALLVYFYELDYATEPYYQELSQGLKPIGEYPFAFIFGPNN